MRGILQKMRAEHQNPVTYYLPLGDFSTPLQPYLGNFIHLQYTGQIFCLACQKKTKTSFSQGYCFTCFKKLAACDMCILKPETCHFSQGTCREPEWAESHCNVPHIVYLANSSGVKVGITRETQIPTRWIDQGASQALPIFRVPTRHLSGLLEVILAEHVADKTNWQALLKGDSDPVDLEAIRNELWETCAEAIQALDTEQGGVIEFLEEDVRSFVYPILQYPKKIAALNFDKTQDVSGSLLGIKGQYLILDTGVINIRKFTSYQVELLSAP